jgi:predicted LPLAT superfamily acyltransferase
MQALFYNILIWASRFCGTWIFSFSAGLVAAGYFVFSPHRRAVGRRFYGILYPDKRPAQLNLCTWKQFQSFTHVYLDRHLQRRQDTLRHTIEGRQYIQGALEQHTGAILLMSHLGNWEVAAHALKKQFGNLKLMLLMGIRHKEAIEKIQKTSVHQDGIRIVGIDEGGGSPFDIVEAVQFLQQGGLVSMTGDRIWRSDQRSVSATLLGRQVRLPEAPYALALVTGAPIIVFFAFRTGNRQYRIRAMAPIFVTAATRDQRPAAIQKAAQGYADHLEQVLVRHPFEWFHFDDILGPKL